MRSSPSPHRYIKNASTCVTTPTKHLLNAGRRPQTSKTQENIHVTGQGKRKKIRKKKETKELGQELHLWQGAVKEEKFSHTRKPPHWYGWGGVGRASEPQRGVQQQGCRGQSRENPVQRIGTDQNSPA